MTTKWMIEDWMSNPCNLFGTTEFDSFESARDEIMQFANSIADTAVANGKYEADSQEYEDAIDGMCEDLYAVEVDENGNKVDTYEGQA